MKLHTWNFVWKFQNFQDFVSKPSEISKMERLQKLLTTEKLTSFAKGSKYSSEMFKLNWNPFSPYSKMCYT